MTPLAFVADRRAAAVVWIWIESRPRLLQMRRAAVDHIVRRRTAANPPHAAAAGERDRQTVGQTYRRTQYRYIDPAACHASTVNTEQTTVIIQHDLVNYEVAHVNYC